MKRLGSVLSAILIAALVVAIPSAVFAGGKTHDHDLTAEIVSIDAKAKTITLKDEKGENHTAPLLGAAIAEAKNLKAGDKVTATCQDNDAGEHEGVKALKKV
jgi:Cu/Ag efflux protein CusF